MPFKKQNKNKSKKSKQPILMNLLGATCFLISIYLMFTHILIPIIERVSQRQQIDNVMSYARHVDTCERVRKSIFGGSGGGGGGCETEHARNDTINNRNTIEHQNLFVHFFYIFVIIILILIILYLLAYQNNIIY